MKKELSIIIVSYNNYEIVKECIESIVLYNDIGDKVEIIVSDNSSGMDVVEKINKEYPFVKTIKNSNIGFGAGNNRGYDLSEGEILLFLNPDTILVEPIFNYVIEKFKDEKELALLGVKLVDRNLKDNDSFFLMDNNRILSLTLFKMLKTFNIYIDNRMYISGADLFVRNSCFKKAGEFDENIFMYYEEPDLIKRIKKECTCKRTSFCKNKKIIHLEGGTEKKDFHTYRNKIERNMTTYRYYCKKWNIDYEKNILRIIRYEKLKSIILKLSGRREAFEWSKGLIDIYKSNIY